MTPKSAPLIYQIYPRSFLDTNGDGVGDLEGVRRRLDYVASLGADMIWLSPFFRSPMRDFGYDVSDYLTVDPAFGNNAVFETLLRSAQRRGIEIMVDLVFAHTSNEHPWFQQSRANQTNAKNSWYVWADPQPDGTPPTNWQALFGGPAFVYDNRRKQYYLRHFLAEQPALNLHNGAVRQALLDVLRFWLDLGVGGVRLDAVPYFLADPELRSNPPASEPAAGGGVAEGNPFSRQIHRYDMNRPETRDFLAELRSVADGYEALLLGEVACQNQIEVAASYVGDGLLHAAYTMEFLDMKGPLRASQLKRTIVAHMERLGARRTAWTFGNHDSARLASRLMPPTAHRDESPSRRAELRAALAKMILGLELTLPGPVCVYQGDELGLDQPLLSIDEIRDPYDRKFYPDHLGRDGARTPLPWRHDAPHGGFSTAASTWLPVSSSHLSLAADRQQSDPCSVLSTFKKLASLRRREPALQGVSFQLLETEGPVLAFRRAAGSAELLAFFNVGDRASRLARPAGLPPEARVKLASGGKPTSTGIELAPYGFLLLG
jgi:alpha-glucosidase